MRGLGCALFATCVGAKVMALTIVAPATATAWLAWLADDAALALIFAAATLWLPRAMAIASYAALTAYIAFNVAVVRAVGRPLVVPMLRGVDPAMSDSAARYLEASFLLPALSVLALAALVPLATRRLRASSLRWGAALALLLALGALLPTSQPPAQRNAIAALARSAWPRAWAEDDATHSAPSQPTAAADPALLALAGGARGRSVVIVVLESAAARFLHPYGANHDPMPFVSELAPRSLLCNAAWAVYPESIKGQLALWHSVAPAPDTSVTQHARVPVPGLAELLAPHGYASGLFHAGRFRFLGMQEVLDAAGFDTLADAATISGKHESSFGVDEESTVAALLRFVDALPPGQPFLAAYLPIAGHHPYSSPPGGPFPTDNQLDCYRNALHYADRAVRALWEGLCQRRAADSLLLCVVGDHGQAFGEHAGNFGQTFALFEENLHVPLLFCAPGVTDAGLGCAPPMSHLDVAPTLLDLLGLSPCAQHRGVSILRGHPALTFAFTDWGDQLVAVRDGQNKLILDVGRDTAMLFDLDQDAAERNDLAPERPAQVARYRAAARAWAASQRRLVGAW